jgi:hypothetical protein
VCFQVATIKCYWNTVSHTKSLLLCHCFWQKGYLTGRKRQNVARCHDQSGLLQHSIRHAPINPGLGLNLKESKSTPRARITMRLKLARSCSFDYMMGKSLRKIGRDRQCKQRKEVYFWLVLSRGFPPRGASSRVPDTHGHTLGMLLLAWHSSHTDLGPGEMSLCAVAKMLCVSLNCYGLVLSVLAFTG